MKRFNSLYMCSCCGAITNVPRGDVCSSCFQWATDSLIKVVADGIQAELSRVEVASVVNTLDKVKAARKALGI